MDAPCLRMDPPTSAAAPSAGVVVILSVATAILAAVASAAGLAVPGFYHRDPAPLQAQGMGQDAVTLLLVVPLLLGSAWLAARGSARAHVAMAGALLYMAYTYATYAFGVRFNALFLVYVAILGASTYALLLAVARLPLAAVTDATWRRMPRRSLAAFFLVTAPVFAALWLMDVVPALLSGGVPQAALEAQTPTSFVHVLDLAFILPLLAVTGALLLARRPLGAMLGGIMAVKAATIALAVLSMGAFSLAEGQPLNAPVAAAMGVVALLSLGLGWRTFAALGPPAPPRRRAGPMEAAP